MKSRLIILVVLFIGSMVTYHLSYAYDATYYSDVFEGSRTANGSVFSQANHSVAVCNEDLGSLLYLQKGQTGVVVTANDYPNCSLHSDTIDLSASLFELFAPLSRGRIQDMSASQIGQNSANFLKKTFSSLVFSSLSIEITRPLSNTYFAGDSILLEGRVLDKKEFVMLYLESDEDKREYSILVRADSNGKFKFSYTLPSNPGKYYFVIASGNSFHTTKPETIYLFDKSAINYPLIPNDSLAYKPIFVAESTPYIWLPDYVWGEASFTQGKNTYKTSGTTLMPSSIPLKSGTASVMIDGYRLSTPSSLDKTSDLGVIWSGTVMIDRARESVGKSKVNILQKKLSKNFNFKVPLGEKISKDYYITYPNGDVRKFSFDKKWLDESGLYLKQGVSVTGSFMTREVGTYRFETVLESGFAYFNIPVYQGTVWGIVETLSKSEKSLLRNKLSTVRDAVLKQVNALRSLVSRSPLLLDDNLNLLAQTKAEYMAENDYIQHKTKEGQDIRGLSKELNIKIDGTLYENIAGGINASDILLQDGLEESGSHRYTMLVPTIKKMGIGYVLKKNKTYLVQVFSE